MAVDRRIRTTKSKGQQDSEDGGDPAYLRRAASGDVSGVGVGANPPAKKSFPVALANALFLAAREVDDDLYPLHGAASSRHHGDLRGGGEARVVKEMIFRIRVSKTDIDGDKAVSEMLKTHLTWVTSLS
jgi:hypothetical protein